MSNYFNLICNNPYIFCLITFIFCTLNIRLLTLLSYKLKLIDKPNTRKKHGQETPLIGGIAIYCTMSILLAPIFLQNIEYLTFWISSLFLVSICVLDDIKNIKVSSRFIIQFLSITLIIFFGKTVLYNLGSLIGADPINLGWLSIPFTCFTLIGVINAVNMMDGIDGITGCVSIVELGMMAFLALYIDAKFEFIIIISCMGCILSFLFFNFPHKLLKKKIFLGDAGSMLIGLILGWLTVRLTQGQNKIPPVLMLWIMSLPLMDTIHLIFNRKSRGVSPFKADRRHIHHILLQLNYSEIQTPLIIMLISLCISATGIILFINGASERSMFLGIMAIFLLYLKTSIYLKKKVVTKKYKSISLHLKNKTLV